MGGSGNADAQVTPSTNRLVFVFFHSCVCTKFWPGLVLSEGGANGDAGGGSLRLAEQSLLRWL